MYNLFLAAAAFGAVVLVLQIVLSLVGFDHDLADDVDLDEGLGLLSVRALSAGVSAYGLGGMAAMGMGLPGVVALGAGIVPGAAAALATAWATRQMLRLEHSGSLQLEDAVGRGGVVHLSVPGRSGGAGKVQFELQGRTVEMRAVSSGEPVPTGTPVTIVGIVDGDTVEVFPTPTLEELTQ
jgi:hypothetical protein